MNFIKKYFTQQDVHKNINFYTFYLLLLIVFSSLTLNAQRTVSGQVISSSDNLGLPGTSILIKGTSKGTITDIDGNYSLSVPDANAILVFQYIGFLDQEVIVGNQNIINITMVESSQALKEMVVIGYGETKKKDATGSVALLNEENFNKGANVTPEQLMTGRIAGVQITSAGGAPGSGQTIRIRAGSSLAASNDPLIVIDGVPVDNNGIAGSQNPLAAINPADIESFSILKDASATAIYGSRASNGVIIVTTKKGKKGAFKLSYNGSTFVDIKSNRLEVLSVDSFRNIVLQKGTVNQQKLLGNANTDWQSEIYKTAISYDNNLSATGAFGEVPYRASVGYLKQEGILKTSKMDRTSAAIGVSPRFLDGDLRFDFNVKGSLINNRFADVGATNTALTFDPTKSVFSDSITRYGGYFEWTDNAGKANPLAPRNPVALLNLKKDLSTIKRSIGNAAIVYRLPFLKDLSANLNVGYDYAISNGTVDADTIAAFAVNGLRNTYFQENGNKLLDLYFNYGKLLNKHKIDATAGYSYQTFLRRTEFHDSTIVGNVFSDRYFKTRNVLVSFFGRANYSLMDKYLFTATYRLDGSSRFSPENRWGSFPAASFAWRLSEEPFIKGIKTISDLKLRLGWGITGQENLGTDYYPYLARYTPSQDGALYQLGNQFVETLRPQAYDANIKWEETTTYNIGLDYGFSNNRFTGTIDVYKRETKDLLNFVPVAAGTNLSNYINTNVGSLENTGVELGLNVVAIEKKDFNWNIGFNISFNKNKITKLTATEDPNYLGVQTGGISGGVGNNIQIHSVGYSANSFFVYKQLYDENGTPLEGQFEDIDKNGVVNASDRYHYKSIRPDMFAGLNTQVNYKNWDFSTVFRGNYGNYVYNNINSNFGVYKQVFGNKYLANLTPDIYDTNFTNFQYFSDYYVEDASFIRWDNITIGHTFHNIANSKMGIRVYGSVQNVMLFTKYKGLDPEVSNGIDNAVYPRPRTFLVGLNFNL